MSSRGHRWQGWIAGLLGLVILIAVPLTAQIVGVGASGHIDFRSGFAPFNAPFGFVTTGVRNVAPGPNGGIFLQRWHLSPDGYAEGGTGLRIFTTASSYLLQVPVNTYLLQRRNACFAGARPAELFIHWDAHFRMGNQGFPPGGGPNFTFMSYPVVGRNAPGAGSYSVFFARLHFQSPGVFDRTASIGYSDYRPGAAFAVQPTASFVLPRVPANGELIVWGDVLFQTRGCPPFFAAAPSSLQVEIGKASSDGRIGVQEIPPDPPNDATIPDIGIDPALVMDMPLPVFPTEGTGTMMTEITEDDQDGSIDHRPQIDVIPEQVGMTGVPISFTANAVDMDGDPLTWSLENAPAGMAIDPFGNVTWTPGAGQSGVYQVKVKAGDNHGILAQTDEQVVTVIVEGPNHAPSLANPGAFVNEGTTFAQQLNGYDPDPGDTLTYTLVSPAPSGLVLSPAGVLSWAPTEDQGPGDYTVRVRVTDDGTPNLWRESPVTIHVGEVNKPPVVQPIPPQSGKVGVQLRYQVMASDSDTTPGAQGGVPNFLSYQLQGAPPGAAIDQNGLLTWTPSPGQAGKFNFAVTVSDNQGGGTMQPIMVTVGP